MVQQKTEQSVYQINTNGGCTPLALICMCIENMFKYATLSCCNCFSGTMQKGKSTSANVIMLIM